MNEFVNLLSTPILMNTAQLGVAIFMVVISHLPFSYFSMRKNDEDLKRIFFEIEKYNYQLAVELRHDLKKNKKVF